MANAIRFRWLTWEFIGNCAKQICQLNSTLPLIWCAPVVYFPHIDSSVLANFKAKLTEFDSEAHSNFFG